MPQSLKYDKADLVLKAFVVVMLAFMPYACMESLDRQAEADYQKCLSWQADGYDIRCSDIK